MRAGSITRTHLAAVVLATVAWLSLAVAPAAAQVEIAPRYNLLTPSAGDMVVAPAFGFSTIAITVTAAGSNVVFTPAAETIPAGCVGTRLSGATSTSCNAALLADSLTIDANVVQVDIRGVATGTMTIDGGADTDTIIVAGPAAPGAIGLLDVRTRAGGDDLTVRGNVVQIQDTSGVDTSPDRYVVESPAITGNLRPGGGDDLVTTDAPALTLDGSDGNDTLTGPGPLLGGPGNDLLKPTSAATTVAGDANDPGGADRVSYERVAGAITLALTGGGGATVGGTPTISGVEHFEGGAGSDSIIGDGAANVLAGSAGNDTIDGRGGIDDLDGGVGQDTVSYATEGAGVVVSLVAGTGGPAGAVDALRSFEGAATGAGNDLVSGTAAAESFALGAGDDQLNAAEGNDSADGGDGNDLLRGGAGRDALIGGAGADTVTYDERTSGEPVTVSLAAGLGGGPGEDDQLSAIENVNATPGPDTLTGDDGSNGIFAGAGRDTISGMAGSDALFGGDNRDVIDGGAGADQLFGEGGDDSLAAFDNEADLVDCGASLDDDAQVDPADAVSGCEYSRRLDIPIPVDADQDGTVASFDCDDADPVRNPAAIDLPADGIDQNCDGFDEQKPFVAGAVALVTRPTRTGRRVRSLRVTDVERGSRLVATCTAPKPKRGSRRRTRVVRSPCAFKTKAKTARLANRPVSFTTDFRNRVLPAGTQIQIRITSGNRVGKIWIYRINSRTSPRETRRCLMKGNSAKPTVCPPEEA